MRSLTHSAFSMKKQNKGLWGAAAFSLVLTLLVVFIPPIAKAFEFTLIGWTELAVCLALSATVILFAEISKIIARTYKKRKGEK